MTKDCSSLRGALLSRRCRHVLPGQSQRRATQRPPAEEDSGAMDDGRNPSSPSAATAGVHRESSPYSSSTASLSTAISSSSGPAPPRVRPPSHPIGNQAKGAGVRREGLRINSTILEGSKCKMGDDVRTTGRIAILLVQKMASLLPCFKKIK
jgi:hypothetical protein